MIAGRELPEPLRIVLIILRHAISRFQEHRCTTAAAAISYHVLFSLFPLLLLIGVILGTRAQDPTTRSAVVDAVMSALPLQEDSRGQVDRLLAGATRNLSAIGIVGLVGLIWSASGMLGSLRGAVELAWEGSRGTRSFAHGKLVDGLILLLVVVFVLVAILAGVIVSVIAVIVDRGPTLDEPLAGLVEQLRSVLAMAVALTTTGLLLLGAYKLLPSPRPPLRYALLGAIVASLLIEGARRLFGYYITNVAVYDVVYGSIGSVIVFLLFIYISATIVLFGAELGAATRSVFRLRGQVSVEGDSPTAP